MQITQMHSQLAELSNEYERISKIAQKLADVIQQIENSQAHLATLKFNIERQMTVFAQISPLKEDNI